jgi:hypothetical protein
VVGQPSSKTSFVVLGDDAGPSKLAAIKKHGLRTLSEDEFLNLIGTRKGLGNGKVDDKTKKKMEKEQEAIRQAAREMEKREEKEKIAAAKNDTGRFVSIPRVSWLFYTNGVIYIFSQLEDLGSVVTTLDDKVCPTVAERDLRQQGPGRKITAVVT